MSARKPSRRPWERVLRVPISRPEQVAVERPHEHGFVLPARTPLLLALGFAVMIVVGSLLLTLPIANREGVFTPYIVALFTATSAVCVTGLLVVDTLGYWSPFGQAVILLLIQVGGLGFMTGSTILLLLIGRRVSLRERILMREVHGLAPAGGIVGLTRQVVLMAVIFEGIGGLILFLRFLLEFPPDWALWMGFFHAVSAFNNAGFDLIGEFRSLTVYNQDPVVLATVAALIIVGSISFTVVADVWRERRFRNLLLDTKMVLVTTAAILVMATLGLLAVEYNNPYTLGPMALPAKLMNAFFGAVTRTAGFSSIDVSAMTGAGLLLTIALMYIGGASGSTAGGIKVNTFAVLMAAMLSSIRGRTVATAFGRELPQGHVYRALTVALLVLATLFLVTFLLVLMEPFPVLDLLFDAMSAVGTVGLSVGIIPQFSVAGKLLIVASMYIGRVGPLTVALALAQAERPARHRYPEGRVKIG